MAITAKLRADHLWQIGGGLIPDANANFMLWFNSGRPDQVAMPLTDFAKIIPTLEHFLCDIKQHFF